MTVARAVPAGGPGRSRLALLAALVVLTGCAGRGGSGDPFETSGPARGDEGSDVHTVRFEVSCGACQVRWEVDGRSGSASSEALWSRRVSVVARPGARALARLSASPVPPGRLSWIRISVDGEVAARASTTESGGGRGGVDLEGGLSVEALVPPPPDRRSVGPERPAT